METEICLVGALDSESLTHLADSLNPGFHLEKIAGDRFSIELREQWQSVIPLDAAVAVFLESFSRHPSAMIYSNGRVRVAYYFSEEDNFALLSCDLSSKTVKLLGDLGLGLEVNFYPS